MSSLGPNEIQNPRSPGSQGQGGIGAQLSPDVKVNVFQAISNFVKIFNRLELGKLSAKFDIPMELIISLVEEWISSGMIFGQIIGRDLVVSKINADEKKFRQMVFGLQNEYQFPTQDSPNFAPESTPTGAQSPVVFGESSDHTQEVQEKFISADIDLSFIAGFGRLKFTIGNASSAKISDIIVKLNYPKTLRLVQVKPSQYLKRQDGQAIVTLPIIHPKNGASIIFYLKPIQLEKYVLKGAIQFTNARDFIRMITVDTLQFDIPVIQIEPGQKVTSEFIEQFVNTCETRGIRSFGLPASVTPQTAFVQVKQILKYYNFQSVSEIENDQMLAAWYYGKEVGTDKEYVAAGQVYNQKIELFISGAEEKAIIGLLADFDQKLRSRMFASRIVSKPEELVDLMCPHCGGTLESFPKVEEKITCKWCKEEFTYNPTKNPH
ncbi:MAG: hypothetical protein RBG13Loki_1060 [Promethearchaeota archaeon CR_4]|nr:MAG: hypothetical protein RBG13Loki_1060 [Candidatus Lokiarchaeota archaeon CR_4]